MNEMMKRPSAEAVSVATEAVAAYGEGTWPKVVNWAEMARTMPDYVRRVAGGTSWGIGALVARGVEIVERHMVSEAGVRAMREAHAKGDPRLNWGDPLR